MMKIVRGKNSNVVFYKFTDAANAYLTPSGLKGETRAFDVTSDNCEMVYGVSEPDFYYGGQVTYIDGVWGLKPDASPAALEAYAAHVQRSIVDAVQKRLDDFAATKNYSGILSACTYATSTNDIFRPEGQYCVEARDATWAKCYQILTEVQLQLRPMPTGYADIEAELPALAWP